MLNRLLGNRRPAQIRAPCVPSDTRIYAIGDIHGSLLPLRALHDLIREHAQLRPIGRKCLVYIGDYIDRGNDSRGVLDLLIQKPLTGFEYVFLKGNHEIGLLRFLLHGENTLEWLAYGGIPTIYSYGAKPPDPPTDRDKLVKARVDLARKIPQEHLKFLTRLKPYHIEGDYLFVHAGIRPGVPIEKQSEDDMLWIRDDFLNATAPFEKFVVHGHSIVPKPDIRPNRIAIDTGAFASGKLTCLILEGTHQEFLTS